MLSRVPIILKKPKIILKNELSLCWASSKNISNTKHTHKKIGKNCACAKNIKHNH
jgi:hypothetical protein